MREPVRLEVRSARRRLFALVGSLSALGILLLAVLALNARELGDGIDGLGAGAAPALAALGILLIVGMVPASLVAGAAGYAIGTVAGTPIALLAATVGGVLCATLGRYVGTPSARYALGRRVTDAVTWVDARPVRTVVTTRLVPGLPFSATSYCLGLTSISLREIGLGTAVGFAPRCFAYVALGGSLRDLGSPETQIALGASVALAVLVVVVPRSVIGGPRPKSE